MLSRGTETCTTSQGAFQPKGRKNRIARKLAKGGYFLIPLPERDGVACGAEGNLGVKRKENVRTVAYRGWQRDPRHKERLNTLGKL